MVELKFPAHFPVDHLADPVLPRLILLLCQFVAFAYYMIDRFVSVTAYYYYYNYYYCYFMPWELFTLKFGWQQVKSQWYSSLDGLHSSLYFQDLQSLYQSFGDRSKSTNYNWYNRHFHVTSLSGPHSPPSRPKSFTFFYVSFIITIIWLLWEFCPVDWDCRIHRLHFYRLPQTSVLDMTLNNLMVRGMQITPLSPSIPGPLWPGVVAPDSVLSMGQIELNFVLMLNWIAWNRTFLIFNCV